MAGILYTPTGLLDPVGPPKDETVAIVAVDEHAQLSPQLSAPNRQRSHPQCKAARIAAVGVGAVRVRRD